MKAEKNLNKKWPDIEEDFESGFFTLQKIAFPIKQKIDAQKNTIRFLLDLKLM